MPVQASLTIAQELGDRAGVAACYHQLGMLAQDRGDYDTAEQRYQTALTIAKELGDQAGTARTLSQLGILRTEQSRFAEGIRFQVQSLALRVELSLRNDAAVNMRMLRDQRAAVGDEQFLDILQTVLDADSAAYVMELTEGEAS